MSRVVVVALFSCTALAFGCGGQRGPRSESVIADSADIYAHTRASMLSSEATLARSLVYVPETLAGEVSVIDPKTYAIIRRFKTDNEPQHVVPGYDLKTLWATNDKGNTLTPIDPRTGVPGPNVAVEDPYNLYFTPDGRSALVVAEREERLDFRDPHSMVLQDSLRVTCPGVDHMEFSADGSYAIATCEFSGQLVKIDLANRKVMGYLVLDPQGLRDHGMPQDIRSSSDGKTFFVADMVANGVYLIDPGAFRRTGFIKTGTGTHGIYPSRDGRLLYITNRGWNTVYGGARGPGSVTVLDPARDSILATWPIPGGGSPDMGGVTDDGKELWLSGRYDNEVYVFDTGTGELKHRIPVGPGPHGLLVWPQPGRYSLGHTGNMR